MRTYRLLGYDNAPELYKVVPRVFKRLESLRPKQRDGTEFAYVSGTGIYGVDKTGLLIKNGVLLTTPNGEYLDYAGIAKYGELCEKLGQEICRGTQSEKPAGQLMYEIAKKIAKKVPFEAIGERIKDGVAIIGISDEAQRAEVSGVITRCETAPLKPVFSTCIFSDTGTLVNALDRMISDSGDANAKPDMLVFNGCDADYKAIFNSVSALNDRLHGEQLTPAYLIEWQGAGIEDKEELYNFIKGMFDVGSRVLKMDTKNPTDPAKIAHEIAKGIMGHFGVDESAFYYDSPTLCAGVRKNGTTQLGRGTRKFE